MGVGGVGGVGGLGGGGGMDLHPYTYGFREERCESLKKTLFGGGSVGTSDIWPILLPAAGHLEERLTVSQSVRQAGRQAVGQAGRQTRRQQHTVGLFSVTYHSYKQWEWAVVER